MSAVKDPFSTGCYALRQFLPQQGSEIEDTIRRLKGEGNG